MNTSNKTETPADPAQRSDAADTSRGAAGAAARPQPSQKTQTILLVEDEEPVREVTREILEMEGYKVMAVSGADEALRIIDGYEAPIHLMLTDMMLPGVGGRELAARAKTTRPDTKVLYISGYVEEEFFQQRNTARSDAGFIQKPFTAGEFVSMVRKVLNGGA